MCAQSSLPKLVVSREHLVCHVNFHEAMIRLISYESLIRRGRACRCVHQNYIWSK